MTKFAWIENGAVRDVCHGDPNECYHPDIAAFYDTQVPDTAVNGDGWVKGKLVPYVAPAPVVVVPDPAPVVYPKPTAPEFKMLLTGGPNGERPALRAIRAEGTDHVLEDFFELLEDPRLKEVDLNLPSIQAAVGYLMTVAGPRMSPVYTPEVIAARTAEILSGKPQ